MSVRVLVVEDEFMIALDVSQQLAAGGFEVVGPARSETRRRKHHTRYGDVV